MKVNKILVASLFYIAWIILFACYNYITHKADAISHIDKRLETAAHNLVNLIPENFHHKGMNKNSISKEEDLKLVDLLNKYTRKNDIYYAYSMVLKNDKIYFTTSSATEEDLEKNNNNGFYFYHYNDAAPYVYDAFKNNKPSFHYINDQWGSFRSAFIPYKSKDGTIFVVGADIHIDYLSGILQKELVETIIISLIFMLVAIPIFRAYTHETRTWAIKIEEQKEVVEKANEVKSEFLSSMNHEFRTPMNAILGYGEILNDDDKLGDEQKRHVATILRAGNHLLELLNDVLDLATVSKGNLKFIVKEYNLNNILNECIQFVEPLATKHNVRIINNINSTSNYSINVDYLRIKQVILNLLSNAIKYNNANGSVTLSSEIVDENDIIISVLDTGVGLTEEEQHSLFKSFVRIGEFKGIDGAGIGLILSKNLIELMGGGIGVECEKGRGCRFYIKIPLSKNQD